MADIGGRCYIFSESGAYINPVGAANNGLVWVRVPSQSVCCSKQGISWNHPRFFVLVKFSSYMLPHPIPGNKALLIKKRKKTQAHDYFCI